MAINFISNDHNPEFSCHFCNLIIFDTSRNTSPCYQNVRTVLLLRLIHHVYLLQMMVSEYISTRVTGVYNNHGSSILIGKCFNCIKINLPIPFWKKIKMANFELFTPCNTFIVWPAWSWKQNVGTRPCKY